jgi:hypothetical protein
MPVMPYSTYPQVANADYSPSRDLLAYQEPFEKTYLTDVYATSPDYSQSAFFDTDAFIDQPLTSVEMNPSAFPTKSSPFNSTLPMTGLPVANQHADFDQSFYQAPFGQLEQYHQNYALDPSSLNSAELASFSPTTQSSSRTPSLCGDAQQQAQSPPQSPQLIKRESPFSPASLENEVTSKRPLRKRGRPRLDRSDFDSQPSGSSPAKNQRTSRLPHNQVERKYREGLNSELERLRKAVPTLPQGNDEVAMSQPKPSKAMILAGAIEYIRKIEKERDELRDEVERLKQRQGQSMGWAREASSLDEFLMDP